MDLVIHNDTLRNLQAAADTMVGEAKPYLKFQKGDFYLGQDMEEIPVGTRFAVNVPACGWGWIRWHDGKVVERRMTRLVSGEPRALRDQLGHHDQALWEHDDEGRPKDCWSPNFQLPMREVDGEQREVILTGSSRGMESAVQDFLRSYCNKVRRHRGGVPIIELGVGGYHHRNRQFGFVKTPEAPIVGWLTGASNGGEYTSLKADLDDEIPF